MSSDADARSQALQTFVRERVAPRAGVLDRDPEELKHVFEDLCALDILPHLGEGRERLRCQIHLARGSAALAFLVKQHLVGQSMLEAHFPGTRAKAKTISCGLALTCAEAIRDPERARVLGRPAGEHILLQGPLRWATGRDIFDLLLVDFFVGTNIHMAILPFADSHRGQGTLRFDPPIETIAIMGAGTVHGEISGYPIDPSDQVQLPAVEEDKPSVSSVANQTAILLGIVGGMIEDVGRTLRGDSAQARTRLKPLSERLQGHEENLVRWAESDEVDALLASRNSIFNLGFDIYKLTIALLGSRMASPASSLHRRWRELTLFEAQALHPGSLSALMGHPITPKEGS